MSYETGEGAILETIQQRCEGFNADNTSRRSWAILGKGKADHYAILRRGKTELQWLTFTSYRAFHTTIIEIWQRYTFDDVTRERVYSFAEAIMTTLEYPTMGGEVAEFDIVNMSEPLEMWKGDGGPMWLKIDLEAKWNEERQVTFAAE